MTNGNEGSPRHFMRLGIHAEQKYFTKHKDKYDVVVFNANLAHYFDSGTATLMANKLSEKPYIIDPITHAFGHNTRYIKTSGDEDEPPRIKTSLRDVANEYGNPVTCVIDEDRPVKASDFSSGGVINEFVSNVLNFQINGLIRSFEESDSKYLEVDIEDVLFPEFVIAPYFYMKISNYEEWLPLNLNFVGVGKDLHPDRDIYAEIVIDRGILDKRGIIDEIGEKYRDLSDCSGYLIWVSDFSENEAALSNLRGLKRLVQILSDSNRPVINLYGGYFSLLLSAYGMTGICHGPGYGEDRDVVPVGGGLPRARYYFAPVHQRLLYREVNMMIEEPEWDNAGEFFDEVCSGATCVEALSGNLQANFKRFGKEVTRVDSRGYEYTYPLPETMELSVNHYLEAKAQEFQMIAGEDWGSLIEQLETARTKYEEYFYPDDRLRYLDIWIEALED